MEGQSGLSTAGSIGWQWVTKSTTLAFLTKSKVLKVNLNPEYWFYLINVNQNVFILGLGTEADKERKIEG